MAINLNILKTLNRYKYWYSALKVSNEKKLKEIKQINPILVGAISKLFYLNSYAFYTNCSTAVTITLLATIPSPSSWHLNIRSIPRNYFYT